jgi:hypothetical protein
VLLKLGLSTLVLAVSARRVSDWLVADHERLHALLTAAIAGSDFDPTAFAAFRVGILRHIGVEEKILLPAARRARGGEAIERAWGLRLDHAALTSLMVPTPDRALVEEVSALLAAHDAKEEGPLGVYAECERLWTAEESARLAAEAEAAPEVRVASHFDGHGTHRTAAAALAAAQRLKPRR